MYHIFRWNPETKEDVYIGSCDRDELKLLMSLPEWKGNNLEYIAW